MNKQQIKNLIKPGLRKLMILAAPLFVSILFVSAFSVSGTCTGSGNCPPPELDP